MTDEEDRHQNSFKKKQHFFRIPRETFVGSLVTRWPWAQDLNKKSNMLKFVTYAWTDGYQILYHQKWSFWASGSGEVKTIKFNDHSQLFSPEREFNLICSLWIGNILRKKLDLIFCRITNDKSQNLHNIKFWKIKYSFMSRIETS